MHQAIMNGCRDLKVPWFHGCSQVSVDEQGTAQYHLEHHC